MKRGASWFIREVTKQLKRDPKSPVRLDATEEELKAFTTCRHAPPWRLYKWTPHANPELRRKGLYRVAFFGSAYSPPAPLKFIPVDWPAVKSKQATIRRAQSAFKKLDQFKTSYGPEYHVELMAFQRPPMFRVWRGEDWLAYHTAEFYPVEVALLLGRNITESRWLEPDAERGKNQKKHLQSISSEGGKARGMTDEVIIDAFREYVTIRKMEGKTIPGINAVISHITTERTGHPTEYLQYKTQAGLFKRLGKIAKQSRFKTPTDWLKSL